jgi:putative endonuclease
MNRQELGAAGEKIAREYLKKHGYKVTETNYRGRHGEIDIVSQKNKAVVFVEVRTRSSDAFGTPEESITRSKREKLVASALEYLTSHPGLPEDWRIDVLAIELDDVGKVRRIEQVENAVA